MDRIAWDDTLITGDPRMDADHRELAGLFNLLRDVAQGGQDRAACAKVFDALIQHAQAHFEWEQRLMARHRYPKTDEHTAEHAMLLRQAKDYRARFDVDSTETRADLTQFAEVWLAFHILFSDKTLAVFLAETRGAAQPRP